jgi:hypothetical protein
MRKIIAITFVVALITVIGIGIYFVAGVSAVYPPIKKYHYLGGVKQLISNIQGYASINPNIVFEITDTVGNSEDGYAFFCDIKLKTINKNNFIYSFKLNETKYNRENTKTEIYLVYAFDDTNKIGGYQIADEGVASLVSFFESDFLTPLHWCRSTALVVCVIRSTRRSFRTRRTAAPTPCSVRAFLTMSDYGINRMIFIPFSMQKNYL